MLLLTLLLAVPISVQTADEGIVDPARPEVRKLAPVASPKARSVPGLVFHHAPRKLAADAVLEDWPSFLGPQRDGHSSERPLLTEFGNAGPPIVWEIERGLGYSSPVVADGRLVFTHRVDDEVHIDCHEAETGKRYWRFTYPCDYEGRYIKNGGPRSTPTILGKHVYVHGVDGVLLCLELATGRVVWRRDTTTEFEIGHDFFGVVSSPLVAGDLLYQNLGAPAGPCVAAFNRHTGELVWGTKSKFAWGPSCASPVMASVHGKQRLFVIAGGDSRPPTGGLLVLNPSDGDLGYELKFRSRTYASVNGSSPVVCDEKLFLTAAYNLGSVGVGIEKNGSYTELWKNRRIGLEFSTPVYEDGLVFAIDGISGRAGAIVAIDPTTGEERARETLSFEETHMKNGEEKVVNASIGAGSLLHADGVFFVLGDTGHLAVVRAHEGKFELVADATLFRASETWTPPVISHGLLYVCQNNPDRFSKSPERLLCYDIRGRSGF